MCNNQYPLHKPVQHSDKMNRYDCAGKLHLFSLSKFLTAVHE